MLGYNALLLMESVDIASETETEEGKGPFSDDDIQITHVSFRIKRLKDSPFVIPK